MKTGRPKKVSIEKKAKITGIRLRDDERQVFEQAASNKGQTLSAWIRTSLNDSAEPQRLIQAELMFEPRPPRVLTVDEIYESATPGLLMIIREDRRIERKPARIHGKELGEYFCMWANTSSDGGLIAIGVSDSGSLDGIASTSVAAINKLEQTGNIYCPDAMYESKRIRFESADRVDEILLFRVFYNARKVVRTSDGRVFVRRGDSKIELKNGEIRELETDKGEMSLEQEDSQLRYPEDFDLSAISEFAHSVVGQRRLSPDKSDAEVLALRRLGRLDRDGQFIPNKACVLLFASDPLREIPGCKVRFLRFDGKEEHSGQKWNAVKDEIIEGTVSKLIIHSAKMLDAQLREYGLNSALISIRTLPSLPSFLQCSAPF